MKGERQGSATLRVVYEFPDINDVIVKEFNGAARVSKLSVSTTTFASSIEKVSHRKPPPPVAMPYEDHSFWMIRFWCDKCGKELPYSSAVHEECTIPWRQEQARFARSEGWVIFGEEHASYRPLSAWCVHCVERLGFSHPHEATMI